MIACTPICRSLAACENRDHMKPDYGAYLHSKGVASGVTLLFCDVAVDHVSLTDIPNLTTLVNKVEDGTEYAISFDFTDEAAAHLLAKAPYDLSPALERAAQATTVRGRTVSFERPLVLHLEAKLTPLQRSPLEVFAPLLVHRVA
jgi:hypothetical protein